ncbi:hypothetical protein [Trinickia fusca]|uniref:Uncharacterized protein n=1 Tax=Trinickia fusca TaxID=2419777 RepID=A0A494X8M4_9BURK|nr:hypothetical protein [Trinickia fusca]RKP44409.1 hypothetical protein D7S89_23110 [Trinickia fusca]
MRKLKATFMGVLLTSTFIAASQCHAEVIYQAKGFNKVPWTKASGETLSPPLWLKLDVETANRKFVVPDFVANDATAMRLAFSYKSIDQRVQGLERVGCNLGTGRRKRVIPVTANLYALKNGLPMLIWTGHEDTSLCHGYTQLETDVTLDNLPNVAIGKHYSLSVEVTDSHPEFKAEGVEVYFLLSHSNHPN